MRLISVLCLIGLLGCDDEDGGGGAGGCGNEEGDCGTPVGGEGGGGALDMAVVVADDLAVDGAELAERVAPGAALAVQISVRNTGAGAWSPEAVSFVYVGDAGWADVPLAQPATTPAGQAATLGATLTAPGQPGRHRLAWQARRGATDFGPVLQVWVEVTCSDGVFCNGSERFVAGACAAGSDPCNDDADCTADTCDEATQTCAHALAQDDCASCAADCTPDCTGRICGDDGCGGTCGDCPAGSGCTIGGQCNPADQAGTCASPLPLLPEGTPLIGRHTVEGDTSMGLHQEVPTCNSTSTAVEVVYVFTVDEAMGLEAMSLGYDTVLHLRRACDDDGPAATVGCSDDSAPPGDYGSRITTLLDPGTYYLIVDGFDATQYGPFTLELKFTAGCAPRCDGLFCGGDDGCGGDCGTCNDGFTCFEGRCKMDPCMPQCEGRTCGGDGCGGSCGECQGAELCVPATGTCATFAPCDHLKPTCSPGCGAGEFCGSDCACHPAANPMPDLVVNVERLANEILFDSATFDAASCAVVEECVGGVGERKLLRFSVEAINQGQATLTVPPPAERPDLFTFSECHGHYHFLGFADYALLDDTGAVVLTGRKQAYCMEDTDQYHQGPHVGCSKQYDCENQGIQAGWSDLYGNALDCQWLDVTETPPGSYRLLVGLNPGRTFEEISLDNNVAIVPVEIPAE